MGQFTSKYEKSHTQQQLSMAFLMPPAGLEPATHGLRVHCSTN